MVDARKPAWPREGNSTPRDESATERSQTERTPPGRGSLHEPAAPGLVVLCHPDLRRVGARALLSGLNVGLGCELSRNMPVFVDTDGRSGGPLADVHISRRPLVLRPDGSGGVHLEADAGRDDYAIDGVTAPASQHFDAARLRRGVILTLARRVVLLLGRFSLGQRATPDYGIVGISDEIDRTRQQIGQVAGLNLPVLIRGETGSGKELVANAVHRASLRSGKPFVAVNMAAVPATSAPSEMFGHRRGAFTDAVADHAGYFAAAHGGTLFLDEIGETPIAVQTLLLRALDDGQIQPVGGKPRAVDVRLIAATDADLELHVQDGRFRDTLLHRIAVCTIDVPPLRKRREDIAVLLLHFLRAHMEKIGTAGKLEQGADGTAPWLPAAVMAELVAYDWPGNVRQLRNVAVEMAIRSGRSDHAAVPPTLYRTKRSRPVPPSGPYRPEGAESRRPTPTTAAGLFATAMPAASRAAISAPRNHRRPAALSDEMLIAALVAHDWSYSGAARTLGIAKNTLVARTRSLPGVQHSAQLQWAEIDAALQQSSGDRQLAAAQLGVSVRALGHRIAQLQRDAER